MNELKNRFIEAIRRNRFIVHKCSMCGYPCHYFYSNEILCYDSGCDCVGYINVSARNERELDFYLDPDNGWLDKVNKFVESHKFTAENKRED